MFIYFEREPVSGGTEKNTHTESKAGSRLWAVSTELSAGLEPMNSHSRMLNQLSHPGASICVLNLSLKVSPLLGCKTIFHVCFYLFFLFLKFILRERVYVYASGRGGEREGERIPSRLHSAWSLKWGWSHDHKITTWVDTKSWMLGAPGWLSRLSVRLWLRS